MVQKLEMNCVNLLENNGLLFCFECHRAVGYLLDGPTEIFVLFNIRSKLYLSHRQNMDGNRIVLLTSSHERDDVSEVLFGVTNQNDCPPIKRARYHVNEHEKYASDGIIDLVDNESDVIALSDARSDIATLSDVSSETLDYFESDRECDDDDYSRNYAMDREYINDFDNDCYESLILVTMTRLVTTTIIMSMIVNET